MLSARGLCGVLILGALSSLALYCRSQNEYTFSEQPPSTHVAFKENIERVTASAVREEYFESTAALANPIEIFERKPTSTAREEAAYFRDKFETTIVASKQRRGESEFFSLNARRLSRLRNKCPPSGKPLKLRQHVFTFFPYFKVCIPSKCSSSSWKKLKVKKSHGTGPPPRQPAQLLVTRHPMSRLVSAYRDKYLNGAPLSSYTKIYQQLTHSLESFNKRWMSYWFPALVSRGDVSLNVTLDRRSYPRIHNYANPCLLSMVAEPFGVTQLRVLAAAYDSEHDISNVTFSFLDFLKHVLWTKDYGLLDTHWVPQHCTCRPCSQGYDYIIEMANVTLEARQVFDRLNIHEDVLIGSVHSTKISNTPSDETYLKGIPLNILQEIKLLYKTDFELFGY